MSILIEERLNLFLLQQSVWLITKPIGKSNYDFNFEQIFDCEHRWQLPPSINAIARLGARNNYSSFYKQLEQDNIKLIHTPIEHAKASELPHWYPIISDLTPRSRWFSKMPAIETIIKEFEFPIFVKGSRQTSKHQKSLSIIENAEAFQRLSEQYNNDPILHWQDVVCREYMALRPIKGGDGTSIPPSFEFRTFWYKEDLVGDGRYWFEMPKYDWSAKEKADALQVAKKASKRVNVPFLVVDVAQRVDGQWIVVECNDGQESGYAGISPMAMWKNIIKIENELSTQ